MLRANSLKIHFVCMLFCSMPIAFAQAMQPPDTADRPTQRWLPFPQGDGIELSEQAQLLQQLRDLISSEPKTGAGDSQLPKLSEQQLQEMEKTLETLRDQFGEKKLPNLENIPKEWIDQGQRQPAKNAPKNSAADLSSRSSNPRNSNSSSTHQAVKPSTPGRQPMPGSPGSPRSNVPKQTPSLPERIGNDSLSTQSAAELSNSDSSNDPSLVPDPFSSELERSNSAGLEGAAPPKSNFPKPPYDSASRGNAPGTQTLGLRPNGNGRNPPSRKPNNWPSPNERNPSPGASDGSLTPEIDIKTQLERHGLGRALQSIVEKTLQEQGESSSAKERSVSRSSKSNSKLKDKQSTNNALTSTTPAAPPSRKPAPPSANGSGQSNGSATTSNAPAASKPNPNASSTMSGLRDMAAQIWGAIRSTPEESRSGLSASSAEAKGSGLGEFAFTWSGRVWLLLVLVFIGVVVLFLLARKRIELATAREAEAELAKEILTEGIRTRADVVRAFHRFVLRRTQPVATWWNHRYVASRLTESSPQLRSVISDLVRVYEHARYLPPEVALSSAEIDCVQAALKQCATGGV